MKSKFYFKQSAVSIFIIILFLGASSLLAQDKATAYQFKINLNEVKDDKLYVELQFPEFVTEPQIFKKNKKVPVTIPNLIALNEKTAIYHIPRVIPGSYSIKNYGSFVSEFKAYDVKGKELTVRRKDKNTWEIDKPQKLAKISYWVDDTWDTPEAGEDIFEPGGTGFKADSLFVINPFGLFGYFDGMEKYSYEVNIIKPENLYGATPLKDFEPNNKKDVFYTENYQRLADSPIMYAKADTAWLEAGDTKVLVALYSRNQVITAKEIAEEIEPILKAQEAYLGGKLPVDNYAYIIYLASPEEVTKTESGGVRMGALEHSYSSFYFLLETLPKKELKEIIRHASAHEFFHIVTPLNIHSEEIGNFDYINPKMSKHLWFYEGLTEYASLHAQIKADLINLDEFLSEMGDKIETMQKDFNDTLPFTEMSEFVIEKYEDQFMNVYSKGALIVMCLDIKLRQLSQGKYGTQDLVRDLSKKYNKDKAFKDDAFFDEIAELTYPEIREFFRHYVEGNQPLPIDEIFGEVGLKFGDKTVQQIRPYSGLSYHFKEEYFNFVAAYGKTYQNTKLGDALGTQEGDLLVSVNGVSFFVGSLEKPSPEGFQKAGNKLDKADKELKAQLKVGDKIEMVVLRKQEDGTRKEITLTATAFEEDRILKAHWDIEEEDTKRVELRNAWLGIEK